MREAGSKLREIFEVILPRLKPGITISSIDTEVGSLIDKIGARSVLKMLGFYNNASFAVNEQVVQSEEQGILNPGDLVSVDINIFYKGFFVDKAVSLVLEPKHYIKSYLVNGVNQCLRTGIMNLKAGMTTGELGAIIEAQANLLNLTVCRELGGHTIGESHHMSPLIPNFDNNSEEVIEVNSFIAIEPIIFYGFYTLEYKGNEIRADVLSAHAEDTVLITESGAEVLT